MGCTQAKLVTQCNTHQTIKPRVTEEQKDIIKRTWEIIKLDISRVGVYLFIGYVRTSVCSA